MSTASAAPIIFPKPLPPRDIDTKPDETGFTSLERITLQNAWRVIKRGLRRHARDISLEFFVKNEMLLEGFRNPKTGKFHLESLYHHPNLMLNVYGHLIEEGLHNMAVTNVILSEVAAQHYKSGIVLSEVATMAIAVKTHLQTVLNKISSPTLILALDKMTQLICDFHNQDKLKEKESEDEYNVEILEDDDGRGKSA